jgi:hypothetical protein
MLDTSARTGRLASLALMLVSAMTACHPGGREHAGAPEGEESTSAQQSAVTVGVPDACAALAAADIAAAFGDPGAGTPSGEGSRRICSYANGITVGVSEANQYEPSVAIARQNTNCRDLTGVGERAVFCDTAGVVGQLMWVTGGLMVDVSAGSTDEAAFTALAGKLQHAH